MLTLFFIAPLPFYWSSLACHVHEKDYGKSLLSIGNIGCILFITGIGHSQIITVHFYFSSKYSKVLNVRPYRDLVCYISCK
jgi:cell division protein FtsW (lipid II flippase)